MPLLFDISSLARWTGPPVGMIRVQLELLRHLPKDAVPVFFDPADDSLRRLVPSWDALVLGETGCIDLGDRTSCGVIPSRYAMFLALERHRLTSGTWRAKWAGRLQNWLLALRRHDLVTTDEAGNRLARVPSKMALGPALTPGPRDVLLTAGYGWYHAPAAAMAALKRQLGFQLVPICYDIIPLQRPGWFAGKDAVACKTYWDAMFPLADRLIVNSHAVANDILEYCDHNGLNPPPLCRVPLGATPPDADLPGTATLPEGLEAERYALFVSTIEPRKGHAMLLRAWRQMLATHDAKGFRLVFVGRAGWNVDPVLQEVQSMQENGELLHLPRASDATLKALIAHSGFCLYPSEYEGFGLPIIEAFAYGKAVITSNGGALPEAAAGLAICLDPHDAASWARAIGAWITEPALCREAAAKIRENFVPRGWNQAAPELIAAALAARA
jgi:glycosyltransferase involved in cell wall biosynthesis